MPIKKKPKKSKAIQKFFSDPIFGTGFNLYIGDFDGWNKTYSKFYDGEKVTIEQKGRYISRKAPDGINHFSCIYLREKSTPTFCHELIHLLQHQVAERLGATLNHGSEEFFAYLMEYYVNLYLKHVEGRK